MKRLFPIFAFITLIACDNQPQVGITDPDQVLSAVSAPWAGAEISFSSNIFSGPTFDEFLARYTDNCALPAGTRIVGTYSWKFAWDEGDNIFSDYNSVCRPSWNDVSVDPSTATYCDVNTTVNGTFVYQSQRTGWVRVHFNCVGKYQGQYIYTYEDILPDGPAPESSVDWPETSEGWVYPSLYQFNDALFWSHLIESGKGRLK